MSKFYEDILMNQENGDATCAVLIDLSKAFDSVNRNILLYKLFKYGIRGPTHKLLKSYLTDRKQFIQVDNTKSTIWPTDVGVPQGSIISPLLFLILINDLQNCTNMEVLNFADDTLIYQKISKHDTNTEHIINTELNKVSTWIRSNHLKLNFVKTNYIIFNPKSKNFQSVNKIKLLINNYKIERSKTCKYLGITIDENLTWKPHIEKLTTKISKAVGILYKVRRYLNKSSLNILFHSIICSHIKYGIICYARAYKTTLNPLTILLNRALRCINFISKLDKKNTSILYYEQQTLELKDIFKLELAKFCFKFYNNLLPEPFNNLFTNTSSIHSYPTRSSIGTFHRSKQRKKAGFTTLRNLGAQLWNQIPISIRNKNSINTFKFNYKQYLLDNYQK